MIDFEQMAGRGGRDGSTKCLVMLLAEAWLFAPEDERNTNNPNIRTKSSRTDDDVFNYAQTDECRRAFLANLNEDTTDDGKFRQHIYAHIY